MRSRILQFYALSDPTNSTNSKEARLVGHCIIASAKTLRKDSVAKANLEAAYIVVYHETKAVGDILYPIV